MFLFLNFIYLFVVCRLSVAVHGLSLVETSRGYSLVVVCRLLIVVASFVAEHRLWALWALVVLGEGLRCLDQGSNP